MPPEFRCPQCRQQFPNFSTLQRHLETHMITGDWLCALCNTLVNRYSALTHHWRNSCAELKEIFCDDELRRMGTDDLREVAFRYTIDRYSVPMEQQNPEELEDFPENSSICTFCHLHVPRGCMTHHLKAHTLRRTVGQRIRDSTVSYLCDLCGFGFRYRTSLITHWREKCAELRAYFKKPTEIDKQCLKEIVLSILKQAEIFVPIPIDESEFPREEEDVESENEEEEASTSSASSLILPSESPNRALWNIDRDQPKPTCPDCYRQFFSIGRLQTHQKSFHSSKKSIFHCELCQTKIGQQRVLLKHLRESCRAMRVEEPNEKRRRAMSRMELMGVVEKGRSHWQELFEKKRAANLQFITQFLNELDRKRHQNQNQREHILLEPAAQNVLLEPGERSCEICNIKFHDFRFLQQHIQMVHHQEPAEPKMSSAHKITVTTSSLLPYFRTTFATFYDDEGAEFRMGKYQEPKSILKSTVLRAGQLIPSSGSFHVEIQGSEELVVLTEPELREVCDSEGRLKRLWHEDPRVFDDIPVLERQVA